MSIKNNLLMLSLLCLLSACGFHLKGQLKLPSTLQSIYIQKPPVFSSFLRQLDTTLKQEKITLLKHPDKGSSTLSIIKVSHSQKLINLSGANEAGQYRMVQSVTFQLLSSKKGTPPLIPTTTLQATRHYNSNAMMALSAHSIEARLLKQMNQQLIQTILSKMASVNTAS